MGTQGAAALASRREAAGGASLRHLGVGLRPPQGDSDRCCRRWPWETNTLVTPSVGRCFPIGAASAFSPLCAGSRAGLGAAGLCGESPWRARAAPAPRGAECARSALWAWRPHLALLSSRRRFLPASREGPLYPGAWPCAPSEQPGAASQGPACSRHAGSVCRASLGTSVPESQLQARVGPPPGPLVHTSVLGAPEPLCRWLLRRRGRTVGFLPRVLGQRVPSKATVFETFTFYWQVHLGEGRRSQSEARRSRSFLRAFAAFHASLSVGHGAFLLGGH